MDKIIKTIKILIPLSIGVYCNVLLRIQMYRAFVSFILQVRGLIVRSIIC
jgi:hypothetical protein